MRTYMLFFVSYIFANNIFAQTDTIWYNHYWEEVPKSEADYYSFKPSKTGDLYDIKLYYTSGQLKMEGRSKNDLIEDMYFEGEVITYRADGSVSEKLMTANGRIHGKVTSYDKQQTLREAVYENGEIVSGAANYDYDMYQYLEKIENGQRIVVEYADSLTGIRTG